MKILLTSAVLAAISSAAAAEIPDIDSSKWATNPRDYGMSPAEYNLHHGASLAIGAALKTSSA
ncbi:hypothetical protein [Falsihalocynthiibacter arcticus]|uniref:hypothetical protein n=1 Tax=Falsihalocynthiibacter arcticus TaxID=1579316 RepID=UPI003000FEEE